jgi:hypothetical protein
MYIEPDLQISQRFLAIAQQDLKAARCLYDHDYFPQAVFYLEQSAEKGLKSFAIFAGMITEPEARRPISHQTMKIYSKTTTGFKDRIDTLNSNIHSDPRLERMFDGIVDSSRLSHQLDRTLIFIQTVSKENVVTISKNDKRLRNYLVSLKKLHQEYNDIRDLIQKFTISETEFRTFKKMLLNMIKRYFEEQPDEYKKVKIEIDKKLTFDFYLKSMREYLSLLLPPMFIYSSFFYLSRLLAPNALSRYPEGDFDPLEFYNRRLPLIQQFQYLADYVNSLLTMLKENYAILKMEADK